MALYVTCIHQELAGQLRRPAMVTVACQTTPRKATTAACQTLPASAVHQACQTMQHTSVAASCQTTPVKVALDHDGCAPTALAQLLGAKSSGKRSSCEEGRQSRKRAKTLVDEDQVQLHVQQQLLRARVQALVQALHTGL